MGTIKIVKANNEKELRKQITDINKSYHVLNVTELQHDNNFWLLLLVVE